MQFGVTLDTVPKINNELEEQVIGKFIVNFGETFIVERYVSNVFYSERIVRVFYSQSDKILGVFYPK